MSINYKVDGSVVLITIDRPKKMNALDSDLQRKPGPEQGQNVRKGNDTHGALAVYGCATADLTQVAESVCSASAFG